MPNSRKLQFLCDVWFSCFSILRMTNDWKINDWFDWNTKSNEYLIKNPSANISAVQSNWFTTGSQTYKFTNWVTPAKKLENLNKFGFWAHQVKGNF